MASEVFDFEALMTQFSETGRLDFELTWNESILLLTLLRAHSNFLHCASALGKIWYGFKTFVLDVRVSLTSPRLVAAVSLHLSCRPSVHLWRQSNDGDLVFIEFRTAITETEETDTHHSEIS